MKTLCEICFYTGNESEFLAASDFCIECVSVHSMCPRCKSGYHSVHVIEQPCILKIRSLLSHINNAGYRTLNGL